jgi:hypothetical protein
VIFDLSLTRSVTSVKRLSKWGLRSPEFEGVVFTTEIHPRFRAEDDDEPVQILVGMNWVGCCRIAMRDLAQPRCNSEDHASPLEAEGYGEDPS